MTGTGRTPLRCGLTLASLLMASAGHGATVAGAVTGPDGHAFKGAFVQAQNTGTRMTFSVLSDKDGRYRIDQLPAGIYVVQIRTSGYKADAHSGVRLGANDSGTHDFALQPAAVRWNELSMYQGKMLFPEGKGKEILVQRCWACHGFETRMASVTRDEDGWRDRVAYMRESMGFFLNNPRNPFTDEMAADVATYLNSLFGHESVLPKSPADIPKYKDLVRPPFADEALKIAFVEYELPG